MKCYYTEIREIYEQKYLKVFFADPEKSESAKAALCACKSVKKINITHSESIDHYGNTLTIYPRPMFEIKELESEVVNTLDLYFQHRVIVPDQIVNQVSFVDIKESIIAELDKAINTIYICVAWFTDGELRDVLISKHQSGVDIKVIVFNDGINGKHGVDFTDIPHIYIRAERHGFMHRKYCVIDNHVVIVGSYNWTDNAANKNDENILIAQDWNSANKHTRLFLDTWNSNVIQNTTKE